jgi:hypothetical protein
VSMGKFWITSMSRNKLWEFHFSTFPSEVFLCLRNLLESIYDRIMIQKAVIFKLNPITGDWIKSGQLELANRTEF